MDKNPVPEYRPQAIERRVQQAWEANEVFRIAEDPRREKYYCLSMFPYPSGQLHMGHVRNYTIGDVIARYQRMRGRNVLQPMGWDAFGLPAENAAIQRGVPPAEWTRENIRAMREQLARLGFGYDWSREISTCDPAYYRWEQWLFTRLFRKGLAYRRTAPVNWCPHDQTVLANEQVVDGRCWRCDTPVERREIAQWFLKITDYAEELLAGLDRLDEWPEQVRLMQRNWIGRSEGVDIAFALKGRDEAITVFTTRPDTLFGVTCIALAPEHPLAREAAAQQPDLGAFIDDCAGTGVSEEALETLDKRGMDTGLRAIHPITGEAVPVWVANFVLMGYGSGAVMTVPAHDERDWAFARAHGLPVRQVIRPAGDDEANLEAQAWTAPGVLVDSGEFTGLTSAEAFEAIADWLVARERGTRRVNYRLRDWGVSRQRYWGAPIPMIRCPACGDVPVPDEDLPVVLPEVALGSVGSPLGTIAEFARVACPTCGGEAQRELDTFDTFMESSWYYARFACPDNDEAMLDDRANHWLPVDQYIGGIEHAILHLLYARFYHRLLRDEGLVDSDEPFVRLLTQGMVLKDGAKMSKSRGNTVDPQVLIDRHGADTVRLFMMFAAPPDQSLDWSDSGVEGASRFLRRLWRTVAADAGHGVVPRVDPRALDEAQRALRRRIHETIAKVTDDLERRYTFNTAIAAVMELLNEVGRAPDPGVDGEGAQGGWRSVRREAMETAVLLLAPVVPHIGQALWEQLGREGFVVDAPWPVADPEAMTRDVVEVVVQVNGRLRSRIRVPAGSDAETLEAAARADDNVRRFLEVGEVRKVITVRDRLINMVVG